MEFISIVPFVFNELISRIDIHLLPFVGVFFILGYWLKKVKLPTWCPKIPLLLFIAGFVTFSVYSAIAEAPESGLDAFGIIAYGLANALFFVSFAVLMYDMKHTHSVAKKAAKAKGGTGK